MSAESEPTFTEMLRAARNRGVIVGGETDHPETPAAQAMPPDFGSGARPPRPEPEVSMSKLMKAAHVGVDVSQV